MWRFVKRVCVKHTLNVHKRVTKERLISVMLRPIGYVLNVSLNVHQTVTKEG